MGTLSRSMTWSAAALAVAVAVWPISAQQKQDGDKDAAIDPRQALIGSLVVASDLAMAGPEGVSVYTYDPAAETPVTADPAASADMSVRFDFLKASDQKVYVPFTVTVAQGALGSGSSLAAYLRLAPAGTPPPEAPPAEEPKAQDRKKKDRRKKGKEKQDLAPEAVSGVQYPWEDLYELTATPTAPGGPLTFSRPFSVPAGDYDVYIAVRTSDTTTPLKVAVLKQKLTVPDYWGSEYTTSSLFVASQVTPLDRVPTGDEQREKPYVIGNLELKPNFDGKFTARDELAIFFVIYNPALTPAKKPDVTIAWQPYKKGPLGESKFKAVEPQVLNGETLPAGFDVDQGHQLVGSLNLPVSAFEPGDYRMAITITDNVSGKTLERDVDFSVTP
jgi:hypothetical protein